MRVQVFPRFRGSLLHPFGNTFSVAVSATSLLQFPVAPSLLRIFAGSKEIGRSFGSDVEDEVVL